MDFIDEAKIYIEAGKGGDGFVGFRREKYIPKGGPDGGDGGHGGDVIIKTNPQLGTLLDFRYQQHHRAQNGQPGAGGQRTGRSGEDLVVQVPVGTCVYHAETGELLRDLDQSQQTFILAKGGRGGHGNTFYKSSVNQAPRKAQPGLPGEMLRVRLELKLLADVALVGFPNAGKSTLISSISAAKPKIGDYPFTTLVPNLGVVKPTARDAKDSFVVADIPGLINGAHEGKGLGLRFLKHIQRSHLLWFILDGSEPLDPTQSPEPEKALEQLQFELNAYDKNLAKRPFFIVVNKLDTNPDPAYLGTVQAFSKKHSLPYFEISAVSRQGLDQLVRATSQHLSA